MDKMKPSVLPLKSCCEQDSAALDEVVKYMLDSDTHGYTAAFAAFIVGLRHSNVASNIRTATNATLEFIAKAASIAIAESMIRVYERMQHDKQT